MATIVIVGLTGLTIGVINLHSQIMGPFAIDNTGITADTNQSVGISKITDTDQDGLTDYEELYVYHTSPYVADSDSDGISDGQEVKNGTDPNCPKGTDCSLIKQSSVNAAAISTTTPTSSNPVSVPAGTNSNLTPQQLRDLLISNGFSADQVNALTDVQLQAAWQAALQQVQTP